MQIGIVGLGRMGHAITRRLLAEGHQVIGWDRAPGAIAALADTAMQPAANAAMVAAGADTILSSISDDAGVRGVFTGPDGFLSVPVAGRLFVEMSTLQPATIRALAPLVEQHHARLIDAPVIGSVPSVAQGGLLVLAGGAPEDIDRARPALAPIAARVEQMGPLGAGCVMKLAVNLGLAAYLQSLAEALALGAREGLEIPRMLDVLGLAPTANALLASKRPALEGGRVNMTLDLQTLRKDVMSALATGALAGVPMPGSAAALASLSAAVACGWQDHDIGDLPTFFRQHMLQQFLG